MMCRLFVSDKWMAWCIKVLAFAQKHPSWRKPYTIGTECFYEARGMWRYPDKEPE